MRWIDRGAEPDGVAELAREHTPGWIRYFRDHEGARPTDYRWADFRAGLGERSDSMCWYCERLCESAASIGNMSATLDHFKPRSKFPELTYDWNNWVFSCRRCNDVKGDQWPENGYVDPATTTARERPERYFDYDMRSHTIIPASNLSADERRRALDTIGDLWLNEFDVQFYRHDWIRQVIEDMRELPVEDRAALAALFESESREFKGSTRMALAQMRDAGEIPENA